MGFRWVSFIASFFLVLFVVPTHAQVVGGMPTTIQEHPWLVALYIDTKGGRRFCGGSRIRDNWVLTAAHCFVDAKRPYRTTLKSGVSLLSVSGVEVLAKRIIPHPDFKSATFAHDLALVEVDNLKATVLRLPFDGEKVPDSEMLSLAGWGLTEAGRMADQLQEAFVPHVPLNICNGTKAYEGAIAAGMMCAGYPGGGIDACAGDSGGPLVWRKADGPVLVGVVSFGKGCAQAMKFGVYTRVRKYLDWIERVIGE